MILCVNIGNTNIQCAVGTAAKNQKIFVPTKEICNAEDFIRFLESRFGADIRRLLQGSVVSSVVPSKTPIVQQAIVQMTGKPPQSINTKTEKCGVDFSGYKGGLGEDRIICCAFAAKKYTLPVMVVDFGTATTVNVVSADRVFLGGAIMAGVQMGLAALAGNTALLPQISDFSEVGVFGSDTQSCLISGAVVGAACMVEGYINKIKSELGGVPTVVITGGNAPIIAPHCGFEFVHEPTLLIDGLFELYINYIDL